MISLILSFNLACFLFLWLKTDFLPYYLKLIPSQTFKESAAVDAYLALQWPVNEQKMPYIAFLFQSYGYAGFWSKILTCEVCAAFWITAALCYLNNCFVGFGLIYIIGLTIYKIFNKMLDVLS